MVGRGSATGSLPARPKGLVEQPGQGVDGLLLAVLGPRDQGGDYDVHLVLRDPRETEPEALTGREVRERAFGFRCFFLSRRATRPQMCRGALTGAAAGDEPGTEVTTRAASNGAVRTLERRREGKPLAVRAQAERTSRRLHARWHALESRGKLRTIVVVAVARELAGHCWALATME